MAKDLIQYPAEAAEFQEKKMLSRTPDFDRLKGAAVG